MQNNFPTALSKDEILTLMKSLPSKNPEWKTFDQLSAEKKQLFQRYFPQTYSSLIFNNTSNINNNNNNNDTTASTVIIEESEMIESSMASSSTIQNLDS